jgi:putative transposase
MARLVRIALVNVPCHVTQRSNSRQFILSSDEDRVVYLGLLRKYVQLYELQLLGYCLMSNPVHLLAIPRKADSRAKALKQRHGSYATYWNATHSSSGHVWQGRFYSCPLDDEHLWIALRYVERNPVRADLVERVESWRWSSAAAHCGMVSDESLEMQHWSNRWSANTWQEYLTAAETNAQIDDIRRYTHSGRPLGGEEFVQSLEQATKRTLAPQKSGRRSNAMNHDSQNVLAFDE